MACCLLNNYIRQEFPIDPFEDNCEPDEGTSAENEDNISAIGTSNEWTAFRNNLAQTMFASWCAGQ